MESYRRTLENLGRRVRALRIVRNLQQREVASRAGVAVGTIARLERSGRSSVENLLRVATALGIEDSFDKLFEGSKYRTLDEVLAVPAALKRKRVRKRL